MNDETVAVKEVFAGQIAVGQNFKRCSPDSRGYTLTRIEPEDDDDVPDDCILAYNIHAGRTVYDILKSEVVYPITERNHTNW